MKFYDIYEDTRSSPYVISIKFSLRKIGDEKGISTLIMFDEALHSAIIEECSKFKKDRYPNETMFFGSKLLMIFCSNKDCHHETVEILNRFNNMAEHIYHEVIDNKSILNEDKLEENLKKFFSYLRLSYTLDSDLPKNDNNKKKLKI